MENMSSNFEFITKGGPLMWPIIGLSIYTVAIVILKFLQFRKTQALKFTYMTPIINLIKTGQLSQAEQLVSLSQGPVARIMETSIRLAKDDNISRVLKESEIERIGAAELRPLDSHMRGLEMTANISPLLGLLGTVMGMVTAFARIADSGARVEPTMLAGGIWEALITTVGGLMVAIPALAAYYIIDSKIEQVRGAMKDGATQVLVNEPAIKAALQNQANGAMSVQTVAINPIPQPAAVPQQAPAAVPATQETQTESVVELRVVGGES